MKTMPFSRRKDMVAGIVEVDLVAMFIFRMELKLEQNTAYNLQIALLLIPAG